MAKLESVRPGDLITAARFNELISQLQQLEDRLAVLEGGATGTGRTPVILDTVPAQQVRAGEGLEVIGLNFTPGNDIITVGGFPIEAVDGRSTATRLLFDVPLLTFSGSSKAIFVTVRNTFGVASKPLTLLPAVAKPQGNLAFGTDASLPNPGTLSPGNVDPYVFGLSVSSQTDIAETYQMSLVFSGADTRGGMSEQAWRRAITLRDVSDTAISPERQIRLDPYVPFLVRVSVVLPASAQPNIDGVDVAVHVRSLTTGAELTQTSTPIAIRVGARTETSDAGVEFAIETLGGIVRKADDGTLEFPYKRAGQQAQEGRVTVVATFKAGADSTEYSVSISPSNSVWGVRFSPTGTRPGRSPGENEIIGSFVMLNQERPAVEGTHPEQAQLKFTTVRHVGGASFTSFMVFPIRGY